MMRRALLLAVLTAVSPAVVETASAQDREPTRIIVTGSGAVEIAPDFVELTLGVRVQGATPQEAADDMARRLDQVVDTLQTLGFPQDSLPTQVFSVNADRDLRAGPQITGYTAAASFRLRTAELERLAEFLGAGLAAGATEVNQVRFRSTAETAAREEALRLAVEAAEHEADVIATARGGQLGDLVEISTAPAQNSQIMLRGPSTLVPQMIQVSARVTATFILRPAGGPR